MLGVCVYVRMRLRFQLQVRQRNSHHMSPLRPRLNPKRAGRVGVGVGVDWSSSFLWSLDLAELGWFVVRVGAQDSVIVPTAA